MYDEEGLFLRMCGTTNPEQDTVMIPDIIGFMIKQQSSEMFSHINSVGYNIASHATQLQVQLNIYKQICCFSAEVF